MRSKLTLPRDGWQQFCDAGFYFRREGGNWIQGACLSFDGSIEEPRWSMISPKPANKYTCRPLWRTPNEDILNELNAIPKKMMGIENFSWALEIIAD